MSDPGAVVVVGRARGGLHVVPVPGRERAHRGAFGSGVEFDGVRVRGLPSREGGRAPREARRARRGAVGDRALRGAAPRGRDARGPARGAGRSRRGDRARDHQAIRDDRARAARRRPPPGSRQNPDRTRGEFVLRDRRARARGCGAQRSATPVLEALLAELPLKQAVALAAKITGGKRNELYAMRARR